MSLFVLECKQCGGQVPCEEGKQVAICPFCGSQNTVSRLIETQAGLVNRANYLRRNNEFDKAVEIYEELLKIDNADYEAHWGLVLCKYGIEYVEDPQSGNRLPTCHRTHNESVFTDLSYKAALEYAPLDAREVYEAEAAQIDTIQNNILALAQKQEQYDVFICYKEQDEAENRTEDSVIAQELEFELSKRGYKVFFARKTLANTLGGQYEPIVYAALQSAKVMVVMGTKPEHFNAVWVRNEWSRYRELIRKGAQKVLIPAYRGMSPYDLPQEFSSLQALDMSKLGFVQDLCDGIDRLTRGRKKAVAASAPGAPGMDGLLRRAFLFIEEGDYANGSAYLERVLDIDPEEPQAYIGKLLIELNLRSQGALEDYPSPLDGYANYQKAIRFADAEFKDRYEAINRTILDRLEKRRQIQFEAEIKRKEKEKAEAAERKKQWEREQEQTRVMLAIRRKKRRKFHLIFWPSLIVSVVVLAVVLQAAALDRQYNQAMALMEAGEYDAAAGIFGALADYRDSGALAEEAAEKAVEKQNSDAYSQALESMQAGDYSQAIELFTKLGDYKDAQALAVEAYYRLAKEFSDAGDMQNAVSVFAWLGNYKDARSLLSGIAAAAFDNGDYDLAAKAWQGGGSLYEPKSETAAKIEAYLISVRGAIAAYDQAVGVFADGTVLAHTLDAGMEHDISKWKNIVAVDAGYGFTVGQKDNGRVAAAGDNTYGQCKVTKWRNISAVAAGDAHTVGLKSDGTVAAAGSNDQGQCDVADWTDIAAIAAGGFNTAGVKADGTVIMAGDNGFGQCDVSGWTDITAVAVGGGHAVGLKADGTVVAAGNNGEGQCDVSGWTNIVAVSANGACTLGLKADGTVVFAGGNENGQGEVANWLNIVAIDAGHGFSLGLQSNGEVVVAGAGGTRLAWNLSGTKQDSGERE